MAKEIHCPSCRKRFRRNGDLNSHLRQSARCSHILDARNAAPPAPLPSYAEPDDFDEDPPNIAEDIDYHAVDYEDHHAGGSQSSSSDEQQDPPLADHPPPAEQNFNDRSKRARVEDALDEDEDHVVEAFPDSAGKVYGWSDEAYKRYTDFKAGSASNPYYPFDNQIDWELAQCVKESKIGDNALTRLLSIPGIVEKLGLSYKDARSLNQMIDHELPIPTGPGWLEQPVRLEGHPSEYMLRYRNIEECVESLYGDPTFADHMHYAPERHYTDDSLTLRQYDGMHTGDWMWRTQTKLPAGSTVIPLVFATDKTQLSLFSGEETAYPVYMTIGNIESDICSQPSRRAWKLVGYLPTEKLEGLGLSEEAARLARARLFHHCMRLIVAPLVDLGKVGKRMVGGDGAIRHCYPLLACYVSDYPEQSLVCCTRQGSTCPKCSARKEDFGRNVRHPNRKPTRTRGSIRRAADQPNATRREELWKEAGVVGVTQPFWADLPHADIHEAITPDVLHQLYQGVVKHVVAWAQKAIGVAELDARFSRMPPVHGVRIFGGGISKLSRVSGAEHKQICKQLLCCLAGSAAPLGVIRAVHALLDFLYLAQYRSHSTETLEYLQTALDEFHRHKDVFINLGIRDDFDLPKLHSLQHYLDSIRLFGTTNNYNTEITERLHIDLVKDAYRGTNKKDALEQMGRWLLRQEAVSCFGAYVEWRTKDLDIRRMKPRRRQAKTLPGLKLSKRPTASNVSLPDLDARYGVKSFTRALQTFVAQYGESEPRYNARRRDRDIQLRVSRVDCWHTLRLDTLDIQLGTRYTHDIIHARPAYTNKKKKTVPSRFDTVFVNDTGADVVGIDGLRVARVRTVFKIPKELKQVTFGPGVKPPGALAYVEWFTRPRHADPNHGMYSVSYSKSPTDPSARDAAIIEVDSIVRTCGLGPNFGRRADRTWTSETVLDDCNTFFVNNWKDQLTYQTIY